jgi:HEAT repeat protein
MDRYEPPSDFLKSLIDDDSSLSEDASGKSLGRLIGLMSDENTANRDWATLILAQQELNTEEVRTALLTAAEDPDDSVRAEAILGLAQRDKATALPLLQRELSGQRVALPLFEAAALVADPSLIEDLRAFCDPSDNTYLDELAVEALRACEAAR